MCSKERRDYMFFNLRAEMARKHINQLEIAVVLGISVKSVSNKMNGKSEFTRKEMFLMHSFILYVQTFRIIKNCVACFCNFYTCRYLFS